MSQIEADQLDYLFEKYTYCADYADEEPKPLGEVGASTDVQLEHDRSVSISRSCHTYSLIYRFFVGP